MVAECDWFYDEGIDEESGLSIVSVKADSNFNRRSRFTFFESIYARPCFLWDVNITHIHCTLRFDNYMVNYVYVVNYVALGNCIT